ncbi:MAG: hypothetical protein EOO88_21290 [Pedobacter sp.]|nr:MAG: hypothetical protein EOO88_21290 [Pedobacter sp.]
MPYSPQTTIETPVILLIQAAESFACLSLGNDVLDAFLDIQEKLCEVMEEIGDPLPYAHTWHFLNNQAQASLMKFLQGNIDALDELKECVRISVELIP